LRNLALLALIPLVGACVSSATTAPPATSEPSRPPASAAPPPTNPTPPPAGSSSGFRAPRVMNLPGVEGLIGANAATLARQLGQPRLDVREGDARKLQFEGQACVLDVYLYPLSPGAEPTATYVDARRASDGLDVDRVSCVKALLGE